MSTIEWTWKSRDGLELAARGWTPEKTKAIVCLVHGHGEHIGRYRHVGEALAKAGYMLLAFDLRGHGLSGGQRGHAPSYESLMDDISDLLTEARKRYPGLPMFLYGHSMGGNQVINYTLRHPEDLKGVIATGPWLRLAFEPTAVKLTLAKVMNSIAPSFSQPSGIEQAALSRDPEIVSAYAADPLVHDKVSARLFTVLHANGLWALEHAADLKIPLLLMHGSADRLTSLVASKEFAAAAGSKITLRIWDGFYHEVHNEPEKAEVIKAMIDWLDQQR
jgi:alpha-beta hydrolase superfamily lysophospholipase